jgi:hypothetical protein
MTRPFLDTSILLGGLIDFGPPSVAPLKVLDILAQTSGTRSLTAWHCCLEFFSVATRFPEEFRLSPAMARELVESEIFARMEVLSLDSYNEKELFLKAESTQIGGGRIYDFHIGQIALFNQATVFVTENKKHFQHLQQSGLPVCSAVEFLNTQ